MRPRLLVGIVLILVGGVWIGQGIGTIHGSFMTGHAIWAVIGGGAVLFGIGLVVGVRRQRRGPQ